MSWFNPSLAVPWLLLHRDLIFPKTTPGHPAFPSNGEVIQTIYVRAISDVIKILHARIESPNFLFERRAARTYSWFKRERKKVWYLIKRQDCRLQSVRARMTYVSKISGQQRSFWVLLGWGRIFVVDSVASDNLRHQFYVFNMRLWCENYYSWLDNWRASTYFASFWLFADLERQKVLEVAKPYFSSSWLPLSTRDCLPGLAAGIKVTND